MRIFKYLKSKKISWLMLSLLLALAIFVPNITHAADTTPTPGIFASLAYTAKPVYCVLSNNADPINKAIRSIWGTLISIMNSIIVLVMIIVAFAEILRIDVNTYGVKKILPAIIMSVILANFSLLICRFVIDIGNIAMTFIGSYSGSDMSGNVSTALNTALGTKFDYSAGFLTATINNFLILALGIETFCLAFLFLARNFILYFLVIASPVAMMALILPQTKSLFNQWQTNLVRWTFMPFVSMLFIWIGLLLFKAGGQGGGILMSVFAGACFYGAIMAPFKLGGAVMTQWGNFGKKAWGATGGKGVDYAKWGASGGFASMMTYRNQMAESNAKLKGKKAGETDDQFKARVAKFGKRASNWTKLNPKAQIEAVKGRFAASRAAYDGSAKKTSYYNKLAGPLASAEAGYAANEDYKYKSAKEVGKMLSEKIRGPKGIWTKISDTQRDRLLAEARKEGGGLEEAQVKLSQEFAATGLPKLINLLSGSGVSSFEIGETKRIAQQYTQLGRGPKSQEAFDAFKASSAVGDTIDDEQYIEAFQLAQQNLGAEMAGVQRTFDRLSGGGTIEELAEKIEELTKALEGNHDDEARQKLKELGFRNYDIGNHEDMVSKKNEMSAGYAHFAPMNPIQLQQSLSNPAYVRGIESGKQAVAAARLSGTIMADHIAGQPGMSMAQATSDPRQMEALANKINGTLEKFGQKGGFSGGMVRDSLISHGGGETNTTGYQRKEDRKKLAEAIGASIHEQIRGSQPTIHIDQPTAPPSQPVQTPTPPRPPEPPKL